MYELKYVIDGVLHTMAVNANDATVAQQMITNMYGINSIQIIDIRRI